MPRLPDYYHERGCRCGRCWVIEYPNVERFVRGVEQDRAGQRLLHQASRSHEWLVACPRCGGPLELRDDGTELCKDWSPIHPDNPYVKTRCNWKTGDPFFEIKPEQRRWPVVTERTVRTLLQVFAAIVILAALGVFTFDFSAWSLLAMSVYAVVMGFFSFSAAETAEMVTEIEGEEAKPIYGGEMGKLRTERSPLPWTNP